MHPLQIFLLFLKLLTDSWYLLDNHHGSKEVAIRGAATVAHRAAASTVFRAAAATVCRAAATVAEM
ncbi:hypothetical protein GBA52_013794 [Prunus armeniaca]|nr:hypothetical protein GBA52_013794 [Prunus armeniaca]